MKAGEKGERGREGDVAIRIPISGSASHASAYAPVNNCTLGLRVIVIRRRTKANFSYQPRVVGIDTNECRLLELQIVGKISGNVS